jgi:histidinol phosphatase-like PHP family hydrolase
LNALKKAINNENVNVIGHLAPEDSFEIYDNEIEEIGDLINKNNKIIEINARYHRPQVKWIHIFLKKNVQFHLASDAHSLDQIGRFDSIKDLIHIIDEYNNRANLV